VEVEAPLAEAAATAPTGVEVVMAGAATDECQGFTAGDTAVPPTGTEDEEARGFGIGGAIVSETGEGLRLAP